MKVVKTKYDMKAYNDNPSYGNYLLANYIISKTPCSIKGLTNFYRGIDAKSHYKALKKQEVTELFELLIERGVLIAILGNDEFEKKYSK